MAEHFDVAVVGPGLAGAIVAAQLARSGRRVVMAAGAAEGPPSTSPSAELADELDGLARRCLQARRVHDVLGLSAALRRGRSGRPSAAGAAQARLQAVFSRQRVDLVTATPAAASCDAELHAEFPASARQGGAPTAALLADDERLGLLLGRLPSLPSWRPAWLPPWRGSQVRRDLEFWAAQPGASWVAPATVDPALAELGELAGAVLPFWGGPGGGEGGPRLHLTRLWGRLLGGSLPALAAVEAQAASYFRGQARAAGAAELSGPAAERIACQGRRLACLQPADGRAAVGADYFVAAGDDLASWLPPGRLARRVAADAGRGVSGAPSVVASASLVACRGSLPPGLAPTVLLLDGCRATRRESHPPLLLWQAPGEVGPRCQLAVACRLVGGQGPPSWTAVLSRLRRLVPYLELQGPPSEWALQALPTVGPGLRWGVFARPVSTPAPNLAYAGERLVPGLALEGAYLAAGAVLTWLQARAGRAWAPPRSEPGLRAAA